MYNRTLVKLTTVPTYCYSELANHKQFYGQKQLINAKGLSSNICHEKKHNLAMR